MILFQSDLFLVYVDFLKSLFQFSKFGNRKTAWPFLADKDISFFLLLCTYNIKRAIIGQIDICRSLTSTNKSWFLPQHQSCYWLPRYNLRPWLINATFHAGVNPVLSNSYKWLFLLGNVVNQDNLERGWHAALSQTLLVPNTAAQSLLNTLQTISSNWSCFRRMIDTITTWSWKMSTFHVKCYNITLKSHSWRMVVLVQTGLMVRKNSTFSLFALPVQLSVFI